MKVLRRGVTDGQVKEAARLYAEAFERKFATIIGNRELMASLLQNGMNREHCFSVSNEDGQLIGLAGFHQRGQSLVNLQLRDFVAHFGYIRGAMKAAAIAILFHRQADNEQQLLMDGIVVDARYRGQGIGKQLFQALIAFAKQEGFRTVKLDVIDENPKAKQLYETLGFVAQRHTKVPALIGRQIGVSGVTTMVLQLE